MAKCEFLIAAIVLCSLASFIQVDALKCWTCSTNMVNGDFCKDPFKEDKLNATAKNTYLKPCVLTDNDPQFKTVCRKLVKEVDKKTVIERRCFEKKINSNPTKQECVDATNAPVTSSIDNVQFCELCDNTDGCNGASGFGPIATLILVPVILAKIVIL